MSSVRTILALGVLAALFAALFLAGPLLAAGVHPALVGLVVVASGLLAVALGARAGREPAPGSVWDHIPSWQYTGRHVESGGLTRDEQERAIADVEERAARAEEEAALDRE